MRYRKKPVEVEAWQVGSDEPTPEWIISVPKIYSRGGLVSVLTSKGTKTTSHGWWLVSDGSYIRAMPDSMFSNSYELAESPICPECSANLDTNWGYCHKCEEWREL